MTHSLLSSFSVAAVEAARWHGESVTGNLDECEFDQGGNIMSRVFIQDPKQIVSCIDFRYITDVLTEEEAVGETSL